MGNVEKPEFKDDTLKFLKTDIENKKLNSYVNETLDETFQKIKSKKGIGDSLIEKKGTKNIQSNNGDFRILGKFSIIGQGVFFEGLNPFITEKVDLDKLYNMNKLGFDNKKLVDELNLAYKERIKEQIGSLESILSKILLNVKSGDKFYLWNTHVSLPGGGMDLYEINLGKKEESFMDGFKRKKFVDSFLISAVNIAYGIKPEDFVGMLNERIK